MAGIERFEEIEAWQAARELSFMSMARWIDHALRKALKFVCAGSSHGKSEAKPGQVLLEYGADHFSCVGCSPVYTT